MAPASLQMVLLQGENADGATVDENEIAMTAADDSPTVSASDRVIATILRTREDAASAGLELNSIGVACTDKLEAAAIRDALAAHRLENVMLVSAFVAAAALTQYLGGAMGYERTAVLLVEPETATLAIVETSDGSVTEVHTAQLDRASGQIATSELAEMVAGLEELPTRPDGLFVVGGGADIASIKPQLEEATSLSVSAPEEPETALARGAALASANAPTFASSTAALAYAQDLGTGAVDVSTLPEYLSNADPELGQDDIAYSAVADDEANAPTVVIDAPGRSEPRRRPGLLVGSAVAVASLSAAVALEVALTVGLHTTVGLLPAPVHDFIAPIEQALAPVPGQVAATKIAAPKPLSQPTAAPAPAAPVPPAPAAPVPVPAAPAPAAPVVPVPVVIPPIVQVPLPPVQLPEPPASPPVVELPPHRWTPPAEPPPTHAHPPQSPPPHQTPPAEPPPNSGGGGGINGPGHHNPSGQPPEGGGPVNGPGPSHGNPGGEPPAGSTPPGEGVPHGGGPVGGGETPPVGGGESHSGGGPVGGGGTPSGGGPVGGGETPSGGGPVGGGETPSGGGSVGGSESHGGGSETGGGSSSSGGGSVGGSESHSGGSESSGGSSSSGGSETGGGGHR